jgi:hypothetical protein
MSKLIGYQIVSGDGKCEQPLCFFSFEVLENFELVETWFELEKQNPEHGNFRWVALPIFEGDVEEPTLLDYI